MPPLGPEPPRQTWPTPLAARYRTKGYWQGETFAALLRSAAARHPQRLAVVDATTRLTYAELLEQAQTAARAHIAAGLPPGTPVIFQMPNTALFLPAVFGLFLAGLIPVFALPAHRETELAHFAATSGADTILTLSRHGGTDYPAIAAKVPALSRVLLADALPAAPTDTALPADPAPDSVAFLQISGGSTGLSKLIPRTHDDYIYSFRASAAISGLTPDSVYLCALPAAHNFAMSSPGIFGTLSAGGCVVMALSADAETAFALIARERVTITGVVPPLALLWLQAAPKTVHDLSSLQVLQVGGAKFTPEGAARVRPILGCTLQQVFGMAEGLVNYTRLDDPEDTIIHTQGRPISPDDEVLVLDDAGNPVPDGTPGHLLTRGPYTIRAYHNAPEANARSFTEDGFYRTGDIVIRRPNGYLTVQGRAGDHINRAGEKISAEEIEDHLLAHPAVLDAAVVSIPDEFLGERSCAFLIAREGPRPKSTEIKAFVRARGLAEFKVPDQVVWVAAFGTTAVGKVSRKALRADLRANYLQQEAGA